MKLVPLFLATLAAITYANLYNADINSRVDDMRVALMRDMVHQLKDTHTNMMFITTGEDRHIIHDVIESGKQMSRPITLIC